MYHIEIAQYSTEFDSSVRDILILISTPAMPALAETRKSHAHFFQFWNLRLLEATMGCTVNISRHLTSEPGLSYVAVASTSICG